MWSYMIKISVGIAYEQNRPHGCGLCPESTIWFLGEKGLKNALYKKNFQTKVVTNHNTQLLMQNFWSPNGCGLCPGSTIRFFGEKCLKMRCTKFSYQTKVVTNQYLQLLCYVNCFDILLHYVVIAASQICSACREGIVPSYGTDFYFLDNTNYRESIAFAQKIDFQILMNLHVLRATETKKVIFGMSSVCLYVCLSVCLTVCLSVCLSVCVSVCGHYNSKNNWASSTKFGMWSYMWPLPWEHNSIFGWKVA